MMKQKDIAIYFDIDHSVICRLLSGERKPSYSQALKFKNTFGGTVEEWKAASKEEISEAFELIDEQSQIKEAS